MQRISHENLQRGESRRRINEELRRFKEESKPDERYEIIVVSNVCSLLVKFTLVYRFLHTKTKLCLTFSRLALLKLSLMCTPVQTPTNTSEWKILFLEILFVFHSVTLEAPLT